MLWIFMDMILKMPAKRPVEKGGHVQQEKSSIGEYGFVAMLRDTEGNAVGIHLRT